MQKPGKRDYLRIIDGTGAHKPPSHQPAYNCPKCKDLGFLRVNVPYGHPQFGKDVKCECRIAMDKAKEQEVLKNMSGIMQYDGRYEDADFEHFKKRLPGVKEAYNAAFSFAHEPDGWLVLAGPVGCGKTHLAVSIAKVRLDAGDAVLVQTVPDLLDQLRTTFDPRAVSASYSDLFEQMKLVKLLVLDDYGAENTTPWAVEKLFQILNYRYNMGFWTVITTNNIGLNNVDPRIKSRLGDPGMVELIVMDEAQDYRPNMPPKRKRLPSGE